MDELNAHFVRENPEAEEDGDEPMGDIMDMGVRIERPEDDLGFDIDEAN